MQITVSIFLLVASIAQHSEAQQTVPLPNWLPDEPIMEDFIHSLATPQMVWLDDNTLIFEGDETSRDDNVTAFQYEVNSDELTPLETSPLRLELTPELIYHFQLAPYASIFHSPFSNGDFAPVIYESALSVRCGNECGGGLIMVGRYSELETHELFESTYHPLTDVTAQCGVYVNWGRADTAVLHVGWCYGSAGSTLYHLHLNGTHPAQRLPLFIGYLSDLDQHVLAISEYGNRVLYSGLTSALDPPLNEPLSLYYWQATQTTESDPLSDVERIVEIRAGSAEYYSFTAANFIRDDDTHILAVHIDGIVRINLNTDEREILNPEINAGWVRLGYFSPDNRHLALVTYNGDLYVVETGI
jgi:hypothetical protein